MASDLVSDGTFGPADRLTLTREVAAYLRARPGRGAVAIHDRLTGDPLHDGTGPGHVPAGQRRQGRHPAAVRCSTPQSQGAA